MLAVRPPDYFPPVAHAVLLASAGHVVLADTFAFSRQAAHNRARILTSQGPQWITVPRDHAPVGTSMARVGVVADGWVRRHVAALQSAYGMAPYAEHVLPEVAALLAGRHASLGALAAATTAWSLARLGASVRVDLASAMAGAPDTLAGVWVAAGRPDVRTLPATLARDRAALEPLGASVAVLDWPEPPRRQVWPGAFTADLSVLDVLMTYGPDARVVLGRGE